MQQGMACVQVQLSQHAERIERFEKCYNEIEEENRQRFERIEATLAFLVRVLEKLPEALKEKVGFQKAT